MCVQDINITAKYINIEAYTQLQPSPDHGHIGPRRVELTASSITNNGSFVTNSQTQQLNVYLNGDLTNYGTRCSIWLLVVLHL